MIDVNDSLLLPNRPFSHSNRVQECKGAAVNDSFMHGKDQDRVRVKDFSK